MEQSEGIGILRRKGYRAQEIQIIEQISNFKLVGLLSEIEGCRSRNLPIQVLPKLNLADTEFVFNMPQCGVHDISQLPNF